MDTDELPDRSGQVLKAKYCLEQRLGIGGMAEVYRARNLMVDRTVAIKLLHQVHSSNRHVVDRFLQEARAANFVRHPNVVEVLDIDTDENGTPFIVQEYLEGEDLDSKLEKSEAGLPFQTAVRMLLPVIKAIGVAHEKGLVHRDLKPENIYLASQRGTIVPKVLDFGISKMPLQKGSSSLTITGTVLGSPAYMSPEQIQNSQSVDPRTDVWSLGIILYKTLTGQLPYGAESPTALFVKICTTDPEPLEKTKPGLPAGLNDVVARCLERNPDARFRDANELYAEVSQVLEGTRSGVSEPLPAVRPLSPSTTAQAPAPGPAKPPESAQPATAPAPQPAQPADTRPAEPPRPITSQVVPSYGEWGGFDSLGQADPQPQKAAAKSEKQPDRPASARNGEKSGRREQPKRERQRSSRRERAIGAQRPSKERLSGRTQMLAVNRPTPVRRPVIPVVPVPRMAQEAAGASFNKSAVVNMLMAVALVIGVFYLVRHIGPAAQVSDSRLGSRSVVPMALATGVFLVGSLRLGLLALRLSSLGLLVADAGMFTVTGCAGVVAWSLVAPESAVVNLLPTTTSVVTSAGAAVPLGLAGYGLMKARERLKSQNTSGMAEAIVLLVLSIGALVAGVNLGVNAMQDRESPELEIDIETFRPSVINIE